MFEENAPGPALSDEQIALCFDMRRKMLPIDLGKLLKSRETGTLQKGKQEG